MKKIIITTLTIGLLISGCGKNNNSTSNSISTNSSSSSSSSVFEGYKDLDVVISNTRYYGLIHPNSETRYIEANLENMYYNSFSSEGYVVLDSDPQYLHAFTTYYDSNLDDYDLCMDIHGRYDSKSLLGELEQNSLIYILGQYIDSFVKIRDDLWRFSTPDLTPTDLIYDLSTFFQRKDIKYCTTVELSIGKDNRLNEILIYEESEFPIYSKNLVMTGIFKNVKLNDIGMYDRWVKAGSTINERIKDYKMVYKPSNGNEYVSVYNNEKIKFEAIVVSKDSNSNVYVAQVGKNRENIGIKVTPVNNCSSLNNGDIVEVEGKVSTTNNVVSVVEAKVVDTNRDADYPPIVDEESVVDRNGGGAYAATFFCKYPQYSGTVYSTYAYVKEMPNALNENSDTNIELVCPKFVSETGAFQMKVVLPASLDLNKKIELFDVFKSAGIYGEEGAYELCLEEYVVEFDMAYDYRVKLLATESTYTTRRLNAQEKVERYFGLQEFPIVNEETVMSYRFGGSTGFYLETEFNLEGTSTSGLYIGYGNISNEQIMTFFDELVQYGASLYDIIKAYGSGKHYIYKIDDLYIDITYIEGNFDDEGTLNMWLYKGDLLRMPTIHERLEKEIPWFNNEDFEILEGTYDYDYTIFKLLDYANNSYSQDNPLNCVTIDTQENIMNAFNIQLIQNGYTQYLDENNYPYMYRTRGQDHYVFTKNGVFVDVACYPTSDYTYAGHDEYEYRLEVLIYQSDRPISVKTYDNLDFLSNLYAQDNPGLAYNPVLPEDAVVEIWRDLKNYKLAPVDYGYGCRDEAFIYTEDIDGCYDAIKQALIDSGYTISREWESGLTISFSRTVNGQNYYIGMFKEPEKGYVRFMNSVLGTNFTR